ncbi:unnamed protein product [Trypanosoma congolense IL3000]|uniref:WGS project CAEQ00000000 data, annotated contig 612 n=1 Tax=Trypanosoma congolense (strain IL3000) TaxID=1068625 RepID=F9WH80_TRYCI|nr:unnamed protein product [Trypanosoma congolense IL3000]
MGRELGTLQRGWFTVRGSLISHHSQQNHIPITCKNGTPSHNQSLLGECVSFPPNTHFPPFICDTSSPPINLFSSRNFSQTNPKWQSPGNAFLGGNRNFEREGLLKREGLTIPLSHCTTLSSPHPLSSINELLSSNMFPPTQPASMIENSLLHLFPIFRKMNR